MKPGPLTFIDLFCGCGGFTLGMLRAGFQCKAAIDFNPQAVATLKANLADRCPPGATPVERALEKDLTQFPPAELAALIGMKHLDVIVGGPPCQGFSTARQRDGSNHGTKRLKEDPRRHLFRNFLDYVEYFQPRVFVIENVLGIRTAAGGKYFTAVQHEARTLGQSKGLPGYRVHDQIEKAENLGVPQKRRRQLIIGVRADLPGYFSPELVPAPRATLGTMLGDAIGDLPPLAAGEGLHIREYDYKLRDNLLNHHQGETPRRYLFEVLEAHLAEQLTNHVARPHSARDLRDFALIPEGMSSAELMRQGVEFEFPYDRTTFKDRYTRQHCHQLCSTIVAHLSKDGLMFIHPIQNRSLTPREAARIQSFPDWFVFPEPRTHSFRMIGNAVPPLIGEAVGLAVREFLSSISPTHAARFAADYPAHPRAPTGPATQTFALPADRDEAVRWLEPFTSTRTDRHALRALSPTDFLKAWHALLWLFPKLDPANALKHGDEEHDAPLSGEAVDRFGRRYTRSGWPVMLEGFGHEAWRRYLAKEFSDEAFYCVAAQRAGLKAQHRKTVRPPAEPPPFTTDPQIAAPFPRQ